MKAYRLFLLVLVAVVYGCSGSGEDELVGNWVRRGDFGGPPRAFASSFVIGENGYVVGGVNSGSNKRRRDAYVFHNSSDGIGSWAPVDSFPGKGREQAVAFTIGNKAYYGTGWDGYDDVMSDFWEYDPQYEGQKNPDGTPKAWRQVASLGGTTTSSTKYFRYGALAFSLNGKGYVGTGYSAGEDMATLLDFWEYTPEEGGMGTWKEVYGYGGSKRRGAVSFIIDGIAYICTGTSNNGLVADMWQFDGQTWKKLRNIDSSNKDEDYDDDYGSYITRYNAAALTIGGKGYVVAGNNNYMVWEYDPVADLWIQRQNFTLANNNVNMREGACYFSFPGGQGYVVAGKSGISAYFEDVRQFFPLEENNTADD